jgi:phosphoribosyl 1,2-cyclic phosphate phosphodiesterase
VPKLKIRTIGEEPFDVLGARVTPIRIEHGTLPVLGFRVGNVAYCTDVSNIPEASRPLLAGLDVLVLGALRHNPHLTHFSLRQAVEAGRSTGARRVLFTHMSHDLEHGETCATLPEGMSLAYDGLRVPLT